MRHRALTLGICLTLLSVAPAAAQTLLGGKRVVLRDRPGNLRDSAKVKFSRDPAIVPLNVTCPRVSTLRLATASQEISIPLDCDNWSVAGSGFRYNDPSALAGGVRSIVLRPGRLVVRLKGQNYHALAGPTTHVEAELRVGATSYCGRFETFVRNQEDHVLSRGPSVPCVPATPTPTAPATLTPTPQDTTCPPGLTCAAFDVVPGPGDLLPADDGASTWMRVFDFTGAGFFGNATNGQFDPGPVLLGRGPAAPDGRAPLSWLTVSYLGANLLDTAQEFGQRGRVCVRIQQDPGQTGWIDCDGSSDADAALSVDSQLGNPPPPNPVPILDAPGATDPLAPAGAALVHVLLQMAVADENDVPCYTLDYSASPAIATAFTTGLATSTVLNDWIDGDGPASAGANTVALGGVPFSCPNWGADSGPTASIAAPFFTLDFVAPLLLTVVDVSQAFRLQLEARPYPDADDTPTPTRTPPPTATDTVEVPTSTATPTPTTTPSPTSTLVPTSTRTFTPPGPVISNLTVTNQSEDWGPDYQAFGNCYEQAKTGGAVVSQAANSFSTKFQQSVATDCEAVPTGGGGITASQSTAYTIGFDVACPAGSEYQLTVNTTLNGAFTINRDNFDGCDLPFFGSTGTSTAQMSLVSGAQSGGALAPGSSLNLTSPGALASAPDANAPFTRAGSALITGIGTGAPAPHTLSFTWNAGCSSNGTSTDTGSECGVRLGLPSDIAPNGIAGCLDADDYPGVGGRDLNLDGHFVTLTASCGTPPTATPTVTPGGPTFTPTATAGPLGVLPFSIVTGPGGTDTAPGCPGEPSSGSLLRTHGNPTGGVPGTVCNGTKGDFYMLGGNLQLAAGSPDEDGVAELSIAAPMVVGASLPGSTPDCSNCDVCWRFEQDTSPGFVDCDGGSAADVTLVIDSNGSAAPPAPDSGPYVLGGPDRGPGAAVVLAQVKRLRVTGTCPGPADAAWNSPDSQESALMVTGSATSRIDDRRQCSGNLFGTACPGDDPYQVTLSGANFDCDDWSGNSGGKLVVPFQNLDESIGGSFGAGDIAQVLRLQD